jgi:predicted enzyme related to lactoylglutathione lyase
MANQLTHFAIHADDLERARKFYGGVFGWKFQGHGGPIAEFCQITDASGNLLAPFGAAARDGF